MDSATESQKPPTPKISLRGRVAITFAGLGFVVTTCVALVAVHFSDSYVHRLILEMLRVESDYLRERYAQEGITPHPRTQHFYVYSDGGTGDNAPPPDIRELDVGEHEISDSRGERHVAVFDVNGQHLYVVLNLGLERARERRFARDLIALVLFGTGLSAWLGWAWAGRAIEPVRRLAAKVEVLEPSLEPAARFAPNFAADEVGALAQAFDRYQEKLYEYIRRERAFTADASHELRTPLAVIRGALEVMLDSSCDAATESRLKRMQRGSDELRDLLDALLLLARSDERDLAATSASDAGHIVGQLLRERCDGFNERHLRVEHRNESPVSVAAPARVLQIVIGNLLRAATQFADNGTVHVDVGAQRVRIEHRSSAAPLAAMPSDPRFGTEKVLGLSMIRRVCERWSWRLHEQTADNGDRTFELHFAAR
ncbi:MAG TPA: HAMP domain-containing sensor histidine kinase [Rudaea sp.]|jgi:signal transduction histidine kinase|nr:HAMP domain-containing sensor histidine kinase [Rudaea sp.]